MIEKLLKQSVLGLALFCFVSLLLALIRLVATYKFYGPVALGSALQYGISPFRLLSLKVAATAAVLYFMNSKNKYRKSRTIGAFLISFSSTFLLQGFFSYIVEPISNAELMEILAFGGLLGLLFVFGALAIGIGIFISTKLDAKI